jgi:hypothetical protein
MDQAEPLARIHRIIVSDTPGTDLRCSPKLYHELCQSGWLR